MVVDAQQPQLRFGGADRPDGAVALQAVVVGLVQASIASATQATRSSLVSSACIARQRRT